MRCVTLISCLTVIGGCAGPVLKLPEDPLRLTVVQRRAVVIPGSDDPVLLWVGDVTGGQVRVSIGDRNGNPYLRARSVREGDTRVFRVGGERYYLSVVELRNFVIGDDVGVFEISSKRPLSPKERSERDAPAADRVCRTRPAGTGADASAKKDDDVIDAEFEVKEK